MTKEPMTRVLPKSGDYVRTSEGGLLGRVIRRVIKPTDRGYRVTLEIER